MKKKSSFNKAFLTDFVIWTGIIVALYVVVLMKTIVTKEEHIADLSGQEMLKK